MTLSLLTLVLLFSPMFQQFTGLPKNALSGVEVTAIMPEFSIESYRNSEYQRGVDEYMKQHLGFRYLFIPVYNQMMWSFYRKTSNKMIVIGKGDNLFELDEVCDYLNRKNTMYSTSDYDKATEYDFEQKMDNLATIQNILNANHVGFAYCINPSKAYVYPEYLPEEITNIGEEKLFNQYEYLQAKRDSLKFNLIDINRWFVDIKDSVDYALFNKTAKHWSTLSSMMVFDSLIRYVEHEQGINITHIDYSDVYSTDDYLSVDYDLEGLLNLMFPISKAPTKYTNLKYIKPSTSHTKPKVIVISDSYWWNIYNNVKLENIFSELQFWYYYETGFTYNGEARNVNCIDVKKELLSADFVFVLSLPCQLNQLGWAFNYKGKNILTMNENDYDQYTKELFIAQTIQNIMDNKYWLESIKQKAIDNNITIGSAVEQDAIWLFNQKK